MIESNFDFESDFDPDLNYNLFSENMSSGNDTHETFSCPRGVIFLPAAQAASVRQAYQFCPAGPPALPRPPLPSAHAKPNTQALSESVLSSHVQWLPT